MPARRADRPAGDDVELQAKEPQPFLAIGAPRAEREAIVVAEVPARSRVS